MYETDWDDMNPETLRSFSRMIYGHEIWLEGAEGGDGTVRVLGLYGHKLVPDKPMPTDYAIPALYDDNGLIEPPDRDIIDEPRGWEFEFPDKGADVYTLYVGTNAVWVTDDEGWHRGSKRDYSKAEYCGAFHMMAKRIISRDGKNPGEVMHAELEILPEAATLKVGSKAVVRVLYEGKPLPNHKVIVYNRSWEDLVSMKTDDKGVLSFDVKDAGTYAFITKYTDESKCSDEFDETVYSTTLTLEAQRCRTSRRSQRTYPRRWRTRSPSTAWSRSWHRCSRGRSSMWPHPPPSTVRCWPMPWWPRSDAARPWIPRPLRRPARSTSS